MSTASFVNILEYSTTSVQDAVGVFHLYANPVRVAHKGEAHAEEESFARGFSSLFLWNVEMQLREALHSVDRDASFLFYV